MSVSVPSGYGSASLINQAAAAFSPDFQQRVVVASVFYAQVVESESSTVANHANRSAFARSVLLIPEQYLQIIPWACVADGSTGAGSTDGEIFARVSAIWDSLSGTT